MKEVSIPVGRVQFLNVFPLTFIEFLMAGHQNKLIDFIFQPELVNENIHHLLTEHLRTYFFVGGMPDCVKTYWETGKLRTVGEIQTQLIGTYRADFQKYSPFVDKRCLDTIFTQTARRGGSQIKYAALSRDFSPPTNKKALDLLIMAKLIRKVPAVAQTGIPLGFDASEKKFKALMLDIGLMQRLCDLNISEEMAQSDLLNIYRGTLAEQFVGQELTASLKQDFFYWSREAKSSTAEVDYIFQQGENIIPIEVKSGVSGRLRSLQLLLQLNPQIESGYVLSGRIYAKLESQKLVFYPIYSAAALAGGARPIHK